MIWTERKRSQVSGMTRPEERGEQRPGDPGEERRDGECHQLVTELVHPHHLGGDVPVADRHEGAADAGALQVLGDQDGDDGEGQQQIERLGRGRELDPEPWAGLGERDERLALGAETDLERGEAPPRLRAPRDARQIAEQVLTDEDQAEGHNGQVEPPDPHRGGSDEGADQGGDQPGGGQPDHHREAEADEGARGGRRGRRRCRPRSP